MEQIKIVISDCHMSAGRFFEGRLNPHEDFHSDDELVDLINFFSAGQFGVAADGPVEVELFFNGDFFDFLNVPVQGEFEDVITEDISLYKVEAIILAHRKVMAALRRFASLPGKRITYLIGNHDADLFFGRVRERITREWDPDGHFPSTRVEIVADRDRVLIEGGVEIRHGNQFEAGSGLNFEQPFLSGYLDQPVLNIPWGSYYVLKIVNRLRWEREFVDKVRPVKVYVLFGLILDPLFTLKYLALSLYYFLKTRLSWGANWRSRLRVTINILKQESRVFLDLEREARQILDDRQEVRTVILGHTHRPTNKFYSDGKQYINTGTWTKMVNLDWRGLGQQAFRTFALVRIKDQQSICELRQWIGEHSPHTLYSD